MFEIEFLKDIQFFVLKTEFVKILHVNERYIVKCTNSFILHGFLSVQCLHGILELGIPILFLKLVFDLNIG